MLDRPPADGSYRKCLKSWTYIHNESVNIFSHLIGSMLFFTLPFGIYKELAPRYATADRADILVFATFFFGVALCFALSTM
jgi:adiponectin receptor